MESNTKTDLPQYKNIPVLTMNENPDGELHIFARRYDEKNILGSNVDTKDTCLHRHEYIQINYILDGRLQHIVHNKEFEVLKGDIFIIPPFIPHGLIPINREHFEIFELEFDLEFLLQNCSLTDDIKSFFNFAYIEPFLVSESELKPRMNLNGKNQMITEQLLSEIECEYKERKSGYLLSIKANLLKLLVHIGRCFHDDAAYNEMNSLCNQHSASVYKAISYLNNHFQEDIKLDDVVKIATLSRSQFCHIFKIIAGKTFVEYLNELRINKAMELLKKSDKSIGDLSFECGFHTVPHFTRAFKNRIGVSPREYRATAVDLYKNRKK